jgi:hypothetical protein
MKTIHLSAKHHSVSLLYWSLAAITKYQAGRLKQDLYFFTWLQLEAKVNIQVSGGWFW